MPFEAYVRGHAVRLTEPQLVELFFAGMTLVEHRHIQHWLARPDQRIEGTAPETPAPADPSSAPQSGASEPPADA
ncbi:MAG: hypothetical protein U0893_15805 [Chloroflexota bacterium]